MTAFRNWIGVITFYIGAFIVFIGMRIIESDELKREIALGIKDGMNE